MIPVILIFAFVSGELFRRKGVPSVIGQILAGILFGLPVIKRLLFSDVLTFVIVDFLAGLEIEIKKIKDFFARGRC
jgi:Kef-type K+ transport system membrane component KefB